MLNKIEIENYKAFNHFKMILHPKDGLNINLLIGRNGSGKSSFLDALTEIGYNNLSSKSDTQTDNTRFNYIITKDDQTISKDNKEKALYDKIVRLYTGYTDRAFYAHDNCISGNAKTFKKALWIYLAGKFYKKDPNWNKIINLIFKNDFNSKEANIFEVKALWLDSLNIKTKKTTEDDEEDKVDDFIYRYFSREPDIIKIFHKQEQDYTRNFWQSTNSIILSNGACEMPYDLFEEIFYAEDKYQDFGFLYTLNNQDTTFEDQFLSDGEYGFLARYALLYLISKTNEKFLILLDEPETHFNEHWKRYFLKLVCDVLQKKNDDVFIATHSAMLITDVKTNELHRFENEEDEIFSVDFPFNTYGANIIDIGSILFKMEGNIGERAKDEIEQALISKAPNAINKIRELLNVVGPGEYRWRLRAKLQELSTHKKTDIITCPLIKRRHRHG